MIVFDHRRKTGGTFLRWELSDRFNYAWFYDALQKSDFAVQPGQGLQLVCGHDHFTRLPPRESVFYFTVLRNPVDVVYSGANAHYRNLCRAKSDEEIGPRQPFLKERIDTFLRDESELEWIWRTKAHWRDLELDRYDFVGVQELMGRTLKRLNRILGTDLTNHRRRNVAGGPHEYRRSDLEERLRPEIELWREARRRLLEGGPPSVRYDPSAARKHRS